MLKSVWCSHTIKIHKLLHIFSFYIQYLTYSIVLMCEKLCVSGNVLLFNGAHKHNTYIIMCSYGDLMLLCLFTFSCIQLVHHCLSIWARRLLWALGHDTYASLLVFLAWVATSRGCLVPRWIIAISKCQFLGWVTKDSEGKPSSQSLTVVVKKSCLTSRSPGLVVRYGYFFKLRTVAQCHA